VILSGCGIIMDYEERTLLKLKRQYSKDETVAALAAKLSKTEIENGKLKSEIDYLKHELQEFQKSVNKLARIEIRKEELYQLQLIRINQFKSEIKKLKEERDRLIAECYCNSSGT
jgi:chromosome segregation ATPase